ncbi:MFS transporter [Sulfurirhabdus autotrophica]|nr:MFS transporter [Sulfurirhabdus autotrophica]
MGTTLGLRAGLEGFPVTATGIIMSAYFLGFVLGTFLVPQLIRRVGYIRTFAVLATTASSTALLHVLFIDPWTWGGLRLVTGFCLVGLYMVIESWLNAMTSNHQRGMVFSTYMAVTLLAMALGQYLILAGDVGSFIPFALSAVLLSLSLIPIALTRIAEPAQVHTPSISLRHLYKVSPLGVLGTLTAGLANGGFWGMGAVFAQRIELSSSDIAFYMSATIIGGMLLQWPIGHLSDRHDRRVVLTFVTFTGMILAISAYASIGFSTMTLFGVSFLFGGFMFTIYSLSVAHVNDHLQPEQMLEATSSLLLIYGIGATLGPTVAGVMMDQVGAGGLMIYFALALGGLGVFALIRMTSSATVPVEEQRDFVGMVRTSQVVLELNPQLADNDSKTGAS